jgi:KipI family sensor histidine kinase inhibitor
VTRHLLPCGEGAVLVELDGLDEVIALDQAVQSAMAGGDKAFAEVVDVVPGARTVLVVVRDGADIAPLRQALPSLSVRGSESSVGGGHGGPGPSTEIAVHYDGPDLEEVCALTGLSRAELVAAHTGTPWQAAFVGFAPGFAYLTGGDERLQVPRRTEPRTSVPPGSVGLAGGYSAVYPRSSPGGWQLIGRTDVAVWDVDRQPPALLPPGSVVRFVDAGAAHDGGAGDIGGADPPTGASDDGGTDPPAGASREAP